MIKLSISTFGQITVCRVYTVSREPLKLPEVQYPVFGIQLPEVEVRYITV